MKRDANDGIRKFMGSSLQSWSQEHGASGILIIKNAFYL
jgi:hypothetical protein